MTNSIAITGEGIVCSIGLDKSSVLSSLRERRSGIGTMTYLKSVHTELPVGEVPLSNDDMLRLLGLTAATYVNRTTLLGMLAVRQCLADAHIDKTMVKERALHLVLISGTTVAGMDITEQFFSQLEKSEEAVQCLKYHSPGSSTRMIADYFDLFSEYTTISTACSSAANALMLGARMLSEGDADIVVAGGTEALSIFHMNGFHSLMILDHQPCRPFDASRTGLNLGEGAAYLVMETEQSAITRGVPPHAYLTGWGNACDACHQTASSPDGDGARLAMTEALRVAGLKPADIQYVNAHGTGTPNNDLSESRALRCVFGNHMPLVSSTKSFTGHATSASGAIEAVICLLALNHQFVPANLGYTQPMEEGIVPTMGEEYCPLHHVVSNSFGFGGNVSEVEITSEDQLAEIRDYLKPLESRRMGKLMKSSLLASLKALALAGVSKPDAIITGTDLGCIENSEQLLLQLMREGETCLGPTLFMQSTHNTISSNIAIRLGCHGYNITYSQDEDSMMWALRDARKLLESGLCKTVLVGYHSETTALFRRMMQRLGYHDLPIVYSKAIVMSCGR